MRGDILFGKMSFFAESEPGNSSVLQRAGRTGISVSIFYGVWTLLGITSKKMSYSSHNVTLGHTRK